jgi:taurine dioxygenase
LIRTTRAWHPRDTGKLTGRRTLYRVTLVGEQPVGPDGQESELVAGTPFGAKRDVKVG